MSPADFVRLRYDLDYLRSRGELVPIETVEQLLTHIKELELRDEERERQFTRLESDADGLEDDLRDMRKKLDAVSDKNLDLEVHKRALEGVLRARTRMNEEIDRKLQELGIGGQGDV